MLEQSLKQSLETLFPPDQVLTRPVQLAAYQRDAGMEVGMPEAVVLPENCADIQKLARWAQQRQVPMTARGAGTSYTGGSIVRQGGIVVSFARMNSILEIDEISRLAVVQPGVVNNALQRRLQPLNLVYPPDPASQSVCTLGGNIAENAGGPHCLKYGVTGNYIMGIEAVLTSGEKVTFGGKALDYPEYDFTSLIVGSEGTLALVLAATLRLRRPYPSVKALTASFATVARAGEAVSAVIAAGLLPATIELMDGGMITIVDDYLQGGFPRHAGAMLIIDVDGYPESLETQLEEIAAILQQHETLEIKIAHSEEERQHLWRGRRSAGGAIARISPNEYLVDVSVPRSRLAEALQAINAIGQRYGFRIAYLAHAGDGNLHPSLLCDFSKPGEQDRVVQAGGEILQLCAEIGGTIGGEHGIGLEKRSYLPAMYPAEEITAMLQVKHCFDPDTLLNPGKIFPPEHKPLDAPGLAPRSHPGEFFIPTHASEAADGLRSQQLAKIPTYTSAGQTHWRGDPPPGTQLSTRLLHGIVSCSTDDLFVTVRSGTPIIEMQTALQQSGFWVPMTMLRTESTVGGALATNANGPLRSLYGGLRDQLLAVQVAMPDGRLLRFGRPLVKDIAGYNMSKLMVGNFGTLGLITEATLKLYPLPRARQSLIIQAPDLDTGAGWGFQALRLAVSCSGIVLISGNPGDRSAPGCTLIYTAEGHPIDVSVEIRNVLDLLNKYRACKPIQTTETNATLEWERSLSPADFLIRAATPPQSLPRLLSVLDVHAQDQVFAIDLMNSVLALGYRVQAQTDALLALRHVAEPSGYAIMAAGNRVLLHQIDPWGCPRPANNLMRSLKLRWDPGNILNRDEFVRIF